MVCPFCGPRELREFHFHKTLPGEFASALERTYERADNPELSLEHWQHLLGCRSWLRVTRNPSTGSVLATVLLGVRVAHD